MAIRDMGFLTLEEVKSLRQYPSEHRFAVGPVAVIECAEEIPCNPCETACPFGAIHIGDRITNIPLLQEELCTGCGLCLPKCPGLAIFLVDKSYSKDQATISFPYEYVPRMNKGDIVLAVDREGNEIGRAQVVRIRNPKAYDRTPIVTIAVPKERADEVRGMRPLSRKTNPSADTSGERANDVNVVGTCGSEEVNEDDVVICRCEEITLGEIKRAIRQGARDVAGIKTRTRAGMGLCQGTTCERLIQTILRTELSRYETDLRPATGRPPVRPTTFGVLGGEANE